MSHFDKIYSVVNQSIIVIDTEGAITYTNDVFNKKILDQLNVESFFISDLQINFFNYKNILVGNNIIDFISSKKITDENISLVIKSKIINNIKLSVSEKYTYNNKEYYTFVFKTDNSNFELPKYNYDEKYKLVFENSPLGFLQFDKNGVITECNNEFIRIIGSSKDALIGFNMLNNVENDGILKALKIATEGGIGNYNGTYLSVTAQKETFINAMFAPVIDENQNFSIGIGIIEDITVRKNIEKDIVKSQVKLKSIFENTSDSILIGNNKGEIISFNKTFHHLTKYEKSDIFGKHIKEIFTEECMKSKPLNFKDLNEGKTIISDRWIKTKNGSSIHIEMNSKKISSENYISIIRDLTERDLALKKIKETQEKNNALLSAFPDLLFVFDENDIIIDYNTQKPEKFLISPENFLHKNFKDVLPNLIASKTEKAINKLKITKEVQTYEYEIISNNHKEIFEAKLVLMDNNKILSVVRDISDRKKIEHQSLILSKVVELNTHSIIVTDKNGNFEYVNPAFEKKSGYKLYELKNKTPRIIKSDYFPPEYYEELWSTILSGKIWTGEFLNKSKNNEAYWDKSIISPIKNSQGKITNFFAINEDITEKKKILDDLTTAKELAEKSDRLKTSFLQNMSHEIRTPLNGILGFAGLISEEENDLPTIKEYANIIAESGNRLLNLINNLIEISQIETGNIKTKPVQFNLNETLEEVYNSFLLDINVKGIKFESEFDLNSEDSFVITDKEIIKQVFSQLIENAIKYTKFGYIKMGYKYENNNFTFFVKDTGIGINQEQKKLIFDSFYKAENINTVGIEGSGVGLSIVQSLVNLLEGNIWVESELKKGSTFNFYIKNIVRVKNIYNNDSLNKEKSLSKTILIAEDDKTSFNYLESILKKEFNIIIHAKNGQEALNYVTERDDIDIILMDIRMPILNGLEATKKIKDIKPEIPIIAQTAYAFSTDQQDVIDAGCNSYITKPVKKQELIDNINKFCKKKQQK